MTEAKVKWAWIASCSQIEAQTVGNHGKNSLGGELEKILEYMGKVERQKLYMCILVDN